MLTPIFIDLLQTSDTLYTSNYLDLDTKDPINLYTKNEDSLINSKEYLLAPRYYVLIYSPANNFQATKKINIEKAPHSLAKNILRTSLAPSIGYGINSCYKIEYWSWRPLLNSNSIITKTKVNTEYWYVPSLDTYGNYIPNNYFNCSVKPWPHTLDDWYWSVNQRLCYMYWPYYYPRVITKEFKANRKIEGDYVIDTINSKEALTIINLYSDLDSVSVLSQVDKFKFNKQAEDWTFSTDTYGVKLKRSISGVNGLEGLAPIEGDNQSIKVQYYLPFHPADMIVQNDEFLMGNI